MDKFLNVFMLIFYIHVCKALKKYGETASYSSLLRLSEGQIGLYLKMSALNCIIQSTSLN